MALIQIRDVPEDVQQELVRRAKEANQSLQQYMRGLVIAQARKPDLERIWRETEVDVRSFGTRYSLSEAVEDVRSLRENPRA